MLIIEEIKDGIKIFRLIGRMDSNTSKELEDELNRAISSGSNKIILDFENLEYWASAGLRVILEAHHNLLKEDGQLILCSMNEYIREIFQITGFVGYVPILDNMDQALKTF
jgi:anti-sigma B factor antagonist